MAVVATAVAKRKQTEDAPKPKPRRGRPIDIDDDLLPRIRMVASALDMSVPDWVNNRLRLVLDEEFPRTMRAMGLAPIDDAKK